MLYDAETQATRLILRRTGRQGWRVAKANTLKEPESGRFLDNGPLYYAFVLKAVANANSEIA